MKNVIKILMSFLRLLFGISSSIMEAVILNGSFDKVMEG